MTYQQICVYFGGCTKAARKLGLTRQGVHSWRQRKVPMHWQIHLQAMTDGALKADAKSKREAEALAAALRKMYGKETAAA
jgi:rare lipoprotein A (peptidoglycan hydrolase)